MAPERKQRPDKLVRALTAVAIGVLAVLLLAAGLARPDSPKPTFAAGGPAADLSRWRYIVVHHSASDGGNAAIFGDWHKARGWNQLGYHFVIGNGDGSGDGQIEVGPRWTEQAGGAHCLTPSRKFNDHGIGICLVGDFERSRPTPAQLASLNSLIRQLRVQHGIGPQDILGHREAKARDPGAGATACPGRFLDMNAVRSAAR